MPNSEDLKAYNRLCDLMGVGPTDSIIQAALEIERSGEGPVRAARMLILSAERGDTGERIWEAIRTACKIAEAEAKMKTEDKDSLIAFLEEKAGPALEELAAGLKASAMIKYRHEVMLKVLDVVVAHDLKTEGELTQAHYERAARIVRGYARALYPDDTFDVQAEAKR